MTELSKLIEAAEQEYGSDVEVALVIWRTSEGGDLYMQDGWLAGVLASSPTWREKSAEDVAEFATRALARGEAVVAPSEREAS